MSNNSQGRITLASLGCFALWLFVALPLIYSPSPLGWLETAKGWQTLIAACIAIVAALIAWHNTSRTLKANADLETIRRVQKQGALRAILPLSLSEISSYCSLTARVLESLWGKCADGGLPREGVLKPNFPTMPTDTVKALADFIEYSDGLDASLLRQMLSRLQVSRARITALEGWFDDEDEETLILELNLEEYLLDTASIYATAAAAFDYARERGVLPRDITWDNVRSALRNMKIWEHDIPDLYVMIQRRETDGLRP